MNKLLCFVVNNASVVMTADYIGILFLFKS